MRGPRAEKDPYRMMSAMKSQPPRLKSQKMRDPRGRASTKVDDPGKDANTRTNAFRFNSEARGCKDIRPMNLRLRARSKSHLINYDNLSCRELPKTEAGTAESLAC